MTRPRVIITRNTTLYWAVFLLMVDRLAKQLALYIWSQQPITIIKNWLSLSFSKNLYIAFSFNILIDPIFVIIPIIIILLACIVGNWYRLRPEVPALILISVGALSNLYDRIMYGYVIDYLDLRYFTIFNLADMMITAGIIWLLWLMYPRAASVT